MRDLMLKSKQAGLILLSFHGNFYGLITSWIQLTFNYFAFQDIQDESNF